MEIKNILLVRDVIRRSSVPLARGHPPEVPDSTSRHYPLRPFHRPDGDLLRPEEPGRHDVHRNADGLHHRRCLRRRSEVTLLLELSQTGMLVSASKLVDSET
jgi:hypothetical protein